MARDGVSFKIALVRIGGLSHRGSYRIGGSGGYLNPVKAKSTEINGITSLEVIQYQ